MPRIHLRRLSLKSRRKAERKQKIAIYARLAVMRKCVEQLTPVDQHRIARRVDREMKSNDDTPLPLRAWKRLEMGFRYAQEFVNTIVV